MNYDNTSKYYNPAIYIWLLTITAMVLLIIVIGGLTRLTDSGLSMTDWRPILGIIPVSYTHLTLPTISRV